MARAKRKCGFTGEECLTIGRRIENLRSRCEAHYNLQLQMTHQEALDLTSPPEIHDALRNARLIGRLGWVESSMSLRVRDFSDSPNSSSRVTMTLQNVADRRHPVLPVAILLNKETPLYDRVSNTVRGLDKVHGDWKAVTKAFEMLLDKCSTPEEMRYLWPSIMALIQHSPNLCERLATPKRPRHIPSLNLDQRELCRHSAQAIASALLLPEVTDKQTGQLEVMLVVS
jgi:hypothetical protein